MILKKLARAGLAAACAFAVSVPFTAVNASPAEAAVRRNPSAARESYAPAFPPSRTCRAVTFEMTSTNGAVLRNTLVICGGKLYCEVTKIRYANTRVWRTIKNTCPPALNVSRWTRPFVPNRTK